MSDRRSPLDFYEPTDTAALPRSTWTPPKPTSSFWDTAKASFRTALDEQRLPQENRLDGAYQPIVDDLVRQGLPRDRLYKSFRGMGGQASPVGTQIDYDAVWRGVAAARAQNAKAYPGLPATREAFEEQTLGRHGDRAVDQAVIARGGFLGQLAGGVPASFADPTNVAGLLLIGGGEAALAKRIVIDALGNMGVEAAQIGDTIRNRQRMGETTTAGQAATEVGMAGAFGAAFPVALAGGAKIAGGAARLGSSAAGRLADRMRTHIGDDNLTPTERAAAPALDREDQTLAISPFTAGAGASEHLARMDAAEAALLNPAPIGGTGYLPVTSRGVGGRPIDVPRETPRPAGFNFDDFAQRTARVESGGNPKSQADGSSAYGLYQITKDTWERFAGDGIGTGWSNRTNPAAQERVFRNLTDHNRKVLARAGVPETAGNLYLLHFAGEGAGEKVLRAAPDTPTADLFSARAIAANRSVLEGRTAGDVVAWAHGKMGDTPHAGPVLSREGFGDDETGDAAWAAAQRQVDAEDAALARAQDASARAAVGEDDDGVPGFGDDTPRAADFGRDPFDDAPADPVRPGYGEDDLRQFWDEQRTAGKRRTAVWAVRDADGRIVDWGHAEEDALDRQAARGDAGRTTVQRLAPGALSEPVQPARLAATLPEARAHAEAFKGQALVNKETGLRATVSRNSLDKMTSASAVGKSRSKADHALAVANADALFDRATLLEVHPDRKADPNIVGIHRFTATMAGMDGPLRVKLTVKETRGPHEPNPLYTLEAVQADAAEGGPGRFAPSEDGIERAPGQAPDAPHTGPDTDVGTPPAPVEGFDHPDDVAATVQIDSLEHDLRMWLDEDEAKGATVRLNEEGDVISAADAMDELDADDAAIDAAWACMKVGDA